MLTNLTCEFDAPGGSAPAAWATPGNDNARTGYTAPSLSAGVGHGRGQALSPPYQIRIDKQH